MSNPAYERFIQRLGYPPAQRAFAPGQREPQAWPDPQFPTPAGVVSVGREVRALPLRTLFTVAIGSLERAVWHVLATERSWVSHDEAEEGPITERALEGLPKISAEEIARLPVDGTGWLVAFQFPGGAPIVYYDRRFDRVWSADGAMDALLQGEEPGPVFADAYEEGPPLETEDGETIEAAYGDPQAQWSQSGQWSPNGETTGAPPATRPSVQYPELRDFWLRFLDEVIPALRRINQASYTEIDLFRVRLWAAACQRWMQATPMEQEGDEYEAGHPLVEYAPSYFAASAFAEVAAGLMVDVADRRFREFIENTTYLIMFGRRQYGVTVPVEDLLRTDLVDSIQQSVMSTMFPAGNEQAAVAAWWNWFRRTLSIAGVYNSTVVSGPQPQMQAARQAWRQLTEAEKRLMAAQFGMPMPEQPQQPQQVPVPRGRPRGSGRRLGDVVVDPQALCEAIRAAGSIFPALPFGEGRTLTDEFVARVLGMDLSTFRQVWPQIAPVAPYGTRMVPKMVRRSGSRREEKHSTWDRAAIEALVRGRYAEGADRVLAGGIGSVIMLDQLAPLFGMTGAQLRPILERSGIEPLAVTAGMRPRRMYRIEDVEAALRNLRG